MFRAKLNVLSLVAKQIPIETEENMRYAVAEATNMFQARLEDDWPLLKRPLCCFDDTAVPPNVYIISSFIDGEAPPAPEDEPDYFHAFSVKKRVQFAGELCLALGLLHINGIFHGDVRNGPSRYEDNVMLQRDGEELDKLVLIDLGDGTAPVTDEDARKALGQDIDGYCDFVESRLFFQQDPPSGIVKVLQTLREVDVDNKSRNWCKLLFIGARQVFRSFIDIPPSLAHVLPVCELNRHDAFDFPPVHADAMVGIDHTEAVNGAGGGGVDTIGAQGGAGAENNGAQSGVGAAEVIHAEAGDVAEAANGISNGAPAQAGGAGAGL